MSILPFLEILQEYYEASCSFPIVQNYLLQISLKSSVNKEETAQFLVDQYKPHMFFCWTFSNIPNFLLCYSWCNTMAELNEMIAKLRKEKIESVVVDVLFKGLFYDTWKEKILYE